MDKTNTTLMLIKMHMKTLFRLMNPHQRCLQAKTPGTGMSKNR